MKYSYKKIIERLTFLFEKAGCSSNDAFCIARSLTEAEACGISSHGIRMVKAHLQRIEDGNYNVTGNIIIEKSTPSFTLVNCNNTIGMVSAFQCTQITIDNAKQNGLHAVFANNANTFSAAFSYVNEIAENGLIGIVFCNSPAQMAPYGGVEKLLGTNPFAYSIPSKNENNIVFDMATSIVAKSKINEAKEKNQPIPVGWAITNDGKPTTDPAKAVQGLLLPMAGPKGYGLSIMIDIIAGLTSGANYLDGVGRFYGTKKCMNVGQTFIAIDPLQIFGDNYNDVVDEYIKRIHNSKSIDNNIIWMPGEDKVSRFYKNKKEGIEISEELAELIFQ